MQVLSTDYERLGDHGEQRAKYCTSCMRDVLHICFPRCLCQLCHVDLCFTPAEAIRDLSAGQKVSSPFSLVSLLLKKIGFNYPCTTFNPDLGPKVATIDHSLPFSSYLVLLFPFNSLHYECGHLNFILINNHKYGFPSSSIIMK